MGLRGVVLDPLTRTPGPDFLINPVAVGTGIYNGQNNQTQVALSSLADGRVFAVWSSYDGSDGDSYAIRGRYFAGSGAALGDDFLINATTVGAQFEPQVTELSDGRVLVTYNSNEYTNDCIRARIIGTDGAFVGNDFVVNTTPGGYRGYIDVTALADGGAMVVWFASGVYMPDPSGGNPTFAPGGVRARIIGADGQAQGLDFQVNSTELSFPYAKPGAITLADGRVLVIWHSGDPGDGDWGCVRGRLIAADGQLIESDFVINTTGVNNQSSPSAAALPDGGVLVTWSSDNFAAKGAQTRGIYLNPIIGQDGSDLLEGTAGQDMMMGLSGDDLLDGGSSDDQLMGGAGNDLLTGGTGNDMLDGGAGSDRVFFTGTAAVTVNLGLTSAQKTGNGTDTIQNIEHVTTGSGNDQLAGNALNNSLIAGDGHDTLSGGDGEDTLDGGVGHDSLFGGTGNDSISGGAGNDSLSGGAGNDRMAGGSNNDSYLVDSAADLVVEFTHEGTDLVQSSADNYTLSDSVENLTLMGSSAISGTGNLLSNILTGNAGSNGIYGGGGHDTLTGDAGDDTLDGGAGNDALIGGAGSDTATYAGAADAVTVNLALTTAQVTGGAGTDMLATIENLIGSNFNDLLTGTTKENRLDGGAGDDTLMGGAGADSLLGGSGNDLFVVTREADLARGEVITGGNGTDELRFTATTTSTFVLSSGVTVEHVVIGTGTAAAAVATATTAINVNAAAVTNGITISGNAGANILIGSGFSDSLDGGAGNDRLTGGGGSDTLAGGVGNDTLTGGFGADVFVFNAAPNSASNKDIVTDFNAADDDIWLARSVMTGLDSTLGALRAEAFWGGIGVTTSQDSSDRILYNKTTGALFYDSDGTGSAAAIQIAQLTAGTNLTASDVFII